MYRAVISVERVQKTMSKERLANIKVDKQDVERVLAIGALLISVLTPQELENLRVELSGIQGIKESVSQKQYGKQVTPAALDAETLLS